MNGTGNPTRLYSLVAVMVALDEAIGERLESFDSGAVREPEITSLLGDLRESAKAHRSALAGVTLTAVPLTGSALDAILGGARYPGSTTRVNLARC